MILAIHTVFVLRENILFIEEWIAYHIKIGVDKFYLYDNSASTEFQANNQGLNRYNIDYRSITQHLSDEDMVHILADLLAKYKDIITVVDWSPRDENGGVLYGQKASILDYLDQYSSLSDWTAFIDMDEFIYCAGDLKAVLSRFETDGVESIKLLQKKFDDRFNHIGTPVTRIFSCIEGIDTRHWAPKIILRNCAFDPEYNGNWSIHFLPVKGNRYLTANVTQLRFNHYNINPVQLQWMKGFYDAEEDFTLNGACYELYHKFHDE